jgi:hypothetical protein
MNMYIENGYENRHDYLASLADEMGVDMETVFTLASSLRPL